MSTTVLTQQVSLDSTGRAWDGGTAPWKWREFEGTAHRSLGIDEWNGPKNHWKFPIEINHLNKKQIDLIGSMNPKIIRLSKRFTSMPNIAEFAAHLALAQKNGRQKNPSHIWEFRGCLENVAVKHVIAGKHKGSKYLNVWQTPRTPLHSFLGHKSVSNFQINLVCIIYSYIYIQGFLMFSFHLFSKRIRPCNPVPFHITEVWHRRHRGATWLCPKGRGSLDELDRPRGGF